MVRIEYTNGSGKRIVKTFADTEKALAFTDRLDARIAAGTCGGYTATETRREGRKILHEGREITVETCMKWFCWHEVVAAMEKQPGAISAVADAMNRPPRNNVPNWEEQFLRLFLETADADLVI